jgi:hypothetical protein
VKGKRQNPEKKVGSENRRNKGIFKGVVSLLFFVISIMFLFSLVNYIHPFSELAGRIPIFDVDQYTRDQKADKTEAYVTSYLSVSSKDAALKDALRLLEKKKAGLGEVESELKSIGVEKNRFVDTIDDKKMIFENNLSIIGEDHDVEKLKTYEYLKRSKNRFGADVQYRKKTYLDMWETKNERLEEKKKEYWREIKELTLFVKTFENTTLSADLSDEDIFFMGQVKKGMLERALFLIDNQDYDGAITILGDLLELKFGDEEVVHKNLLISLLTVLKEYKRRIELLEKETVFAEIKMSYLNEDYKKALAQIDTFDSYEYLQPLLVGLRSVTEENIDLSGEIEDELLVKKRIKELVNKAEAFEEEKEYSKAVKIYENLLILDLPPFDREYLISKMRSSLIPSIENDFKREDNTKAAGYLQSARNLYLDGEEEEALQYYSKVLTECSNSDYVEEALTELIRLIKE